MSFIARLGALLVRQADPNPFEVTLHSSDPTSKEIATINGLKWSGPGTGGSNVDLPYRDAMAAIGAARRLPHSHFLFEPLFDLDVKFRNAGCRIGIKVPKVEPSPDAGPDVPDSAGDGDEELKDRIATLIDAYWRERRLVNNVILFRRKSNPLDIIFVPPEKCTVESVMGRTIIKYTHGLRSDQVRAIQDTAVMDRWSKPFVEWGIDGASESHNKFNAANPEQAEEVWLWRPPGVSGGLAWPRSTSLCHVLAQMRSTEVGLETYAFAGRMVERAIKIGFESKYGAGAGNPVTRYSQKRADAIMADYHGSTGFATRVTQFDQEMAVNWIDADKFKPDLWEESTRRIALWAGPLGIMLFAKGSPPDLWNMLALQCIEERKEASRFLRKVIREVFGIEVTIAWSNRHWQPLRLQFESLRAAVTQGPASLTTMIEAITGDHELEQERKRKESESPQSYLPLWDPSHGDQPAKAAGKPPLTKPGGRPAAD